MMMLTQMIRRTCVSSRWSFSPYFLRGLGRLANEVRGFGEAASRRGISKLCECCKRNDEEVRWLWKQSEDEVAEVDTANCMCN